MSPRAVFQGIHWAYSHLAGTKFFGRREPGMEFVGLDTFRAVVETVERGAADYGILPVENTIAGSINETYNLLGQTRLTIVGEEQWRVRHCLLGLDHGPLDRIRRVLSHPQALLQCAEFLARLDGATVVSYLDTAAAARKVREDGDPTQAAIASPEAAAHFGLTVLQEEIQDHEENYTRFVIIADRGLTADPRLPHKTSLLLVTDHAEGALFRCLKVLHEHHLNLTKLESRPIPNEPWQYQFYVDFEGNTADPPVQEALTLLRRRTRRLRVLGCYPSRPDAAPGNGTRDEGSPDAARGDDQ